MSDTNNTVGLGPRPETQITRLDDTYIVTLDQRAAPHDLSFQVSGLEEIADSNVVELESTRQLIVHVDDDENYIGECGPAIAGVNRVYASAPIQPELMQSSYWEKIATFAGKDIDTVVVMDLHLRFDPKNTTQNATYLGEVFSGKEVYGVISDAKVRNLLPDNFKVLVHTSQKGEVGPGLRDVNPEFLAGDIETHGLEKPNSGAAVALATKVDQIYQGTSAPISMIHRKVYDTRE
jgi:hypothetical protein